MNISYRSYRTYTEREGMSVPDAVQWLLEDGHIEARIERTARFTGGLLEFLNRKGLVTDQEVVVMLNDYVDDGVFKDGPLE